MSKKNKNKNQKSEEAKPEDFPTPDAPAEGVPAVEGEGEVADTSEVEAGTDETTPETPEGEALNTEDPDAEQPTALLGSSVQPAIFTLDNGTEVQLGVIVGEAHERSGMTVKEWNDFAVTNPDDQEAAIQAVVDELPITAPADPDAPAPEPEMTEEEIANHEAALKAQEDADKIEKAVALKRAKREKARKKQASDFREDHLANKEKGVLIYGINEGARYGELSVDADITIVIKMKSFTRKSQMLEAMKKLELAIREDRGNE